MGKAVVYVLIATAMTLFFVFFPSNNHGLDHQDFARRLGRFRTPTFDPLVAKMEGIAEEKGLENRENSIEGGKAAAAKTVPDAYKFYDDEGRLNISLRLLVLFPALDQSPKDGIITFEELKVWITGQAAERLNYGTQKEMEFHDKNQDGAISFKEYLPQFSEQDIASNGMDHGEAGWWKEQFANADADGNRLLNFDELRDFLHPEDSSKHKIQSWILREKMKRMDNDSDGKLSYEEFVSHVYDIYKTYIEFETVGKDVPTAEDKFAELDLDKDKLLTVEELKPLLQYLQPGELSYAQHYTGHLIKEADDNKDGWLSLDEMLNHEYVFYSSVHEYRNGNYEEDFHNEL